MQPVSKYSDPLLESSLANKVKYTGQNRAKETGIKINVSKKHVVSGDKEKEDSPPDENTGKDKKEESKTPEVMKEEQAQIYGDLPDFDDW